MSLEIRRDSLLILISMVAVLVYKCWTAARYIPSLRIQLGSWPSCTAINAFSARTNSHLLSCQPNN